MTQRIEWIDALKGFAILIVVIGHCSADCLASNTFPSYTNIIKVINDSIYSFHMPLFFTISGYVFYLSKSYYKYKLKVLDFTIIYVVWSFLMWLSKFVMGNRINNPVTIESLFKIIYQPIMVYWYLYVLIIFYIVFSVFKITNVDRKLVVVFAIIAIFDRYFNFDIGIMNAVLYHMYFWVLGGYIASSDFVLKLSESKIVLCLVVCIGNIVFYFQHVAFIGIVPISKSIILATAASILLFTIFCRNRYGAKKLLNLFGKNVLAIYVVHCFITAGLRVVFKLVHLNNVYLYFLLGTLLGLIVPILMFKACSRNIFLSMLFSPVNGLKKLGVVKV